MKLEVDKYNYQFLSETEEIIRSNPNLFSIMNTGKTTNDFKQLDVVKCTYIRGLMKVVGFTSTKVIVEPIVNSEDYPAEAIHPEFLCQAKVNKEVVELLYKK